MLKFDANKGYNEQLTRRAIGLMMDVDPRGYHDRIKPVLDMVNGSVKQMIAARVLLDFIVEEGKRDNKNVEFLQEAANMYKELSAVLP